MFNFLEKTLLKSIAQKAVKNLPVSKQHLDSVWESRKDEIIANIKKAIAEAIKKYLESLTK